MRKYIPIFKVPNSYQRIPSEKVIKAVGSIVNNVKISSLNEKDKLLFKKYFIADCNNKKIGNVFGDNTIDQKHLTRVLKKAVDRKILPGEWVADRYKKLLTKGGYSLSTKWEKAPVETVSKTSDSKKSQKSSVDKKADNPFSSFNKRLEKMLDDRKNKLGEIKFSALRGEKEKANPDKDIKSVFGKVDTKEVKGFENKGKEKLKSAGQERKMSVESKGLYLPITSQGNFKPAGNSGSVFVSQDLSQEIDSNVSYRTLKTQISQGLPENEALADEIPEWKLSAYPKPEETAKNKFIEKDLEFGGVAKGNDSFGYEDQKNT